MLLSVFLGFLSGCARNTPAPVHSVKPDYNDLKRGSYRGSYYQVQKGDTLYFIAYISDQDVKDLIARNDLSPPYTIYPGQKLKLWGDVYVPPNYGKKGENSGGEGITVATAGAAVAGTAAVAAGAGSVAAKTTAVKTPSKPIGKSSNSKTGSSPAAKQDGKKYPSKNKSDYATDGKKRVEPQKAKEYSQETKSKKNVTKPVSKASGKLAWSWPTKGRVIAGFSSSETGNRGIDIAGKRGQAIVAAESGKVVYAGNALRGYGNLIILKHNDDYLSAYAHNDRLLVREQQVVKKGQKIAAMGSSATDSVRLHFEIRYKGKSVNPIRYLPRQ
ncbi:peptidoglycan DD-metalloendopeptidase family protein [Parasalinivibrio latis]